MPRHLISREAYRLKKASRGTRHNLCCYLGFSVVLVIARIFLADKGQSVRPDKEIKKQRTFLALWYSAFIFFFVFLCADKLSEVLDIKGKSISAEKSVNDSSIWLPNTFSRLVFSEGLLAARLGSRTLARSVLTSWITHESQVLCLFLAVPACFQVFLFLATLCADPSTLRVPELCKRTPLDVD